MDTHFHNPDDLRELERRLSAWRPTSEGLDADAMLFAAGRASAPRQPARFVWPALTGFLTLLAVLLGTWAMAERTQRLSLNRQPRQPSPMPAADRFAPGQ